MRLWFVVLALVSAGAIAEARTADKMPAFNIDKNCKAEAAGATIGETTASCARDENDAKDVLTKGWARYNAAAKRACIGESSMGDQESYVELLTCIEMTTGKFSITDEQKR